jgi:hypothetical protein
MYNFEIKNYEIGKIIVDNYSQFLVKFPIHKLQKIIYYYIGVYSVEKVYQNYFILIKIFMTNIQIPYYYTYLTASDIRQVLGLYSILNVKEHETEEIKNFIPKTSSVLKAFIEVYLKLSLIVFI